MVLTYSKLLKFEEMCLMFHRSMECKESFNDLMKNEEKNFTTASSSSH